MLPAKKISSLRPPGGKKYNILQHDSGTDCRSGRADISNIGSGNGVIGLALTLAGNAGADTIVSNLITTRSAETLTPTLSTTTVSTDHPVQNPTVPTTSDTGPTKSSDLGLGTEMGTSAGFTPATATALLLSEGTTTTRPLPMVLFTSEKPLVTTEQAWGVSIGSSEASINTPLTSQPPLFNPTGTGNYRTGRVFLTGSASLVYPPGSVGSLWVTGASGAITNAGSINNVSWTFSKSGMTLAPTMTASQEHIGSTLPILEDTQTRRSIHT